MKRGLFRLNLGGHISAGARINEDIRVPGIRPVEPNDEQVDAVHTGGALKLTYEADPDLVEAAPRARPSIVKIISYSKFKYEQAQRIRETQKNQQQTVVKEQKFRPKIDNHNYETRKSNVVCFLEEGSRIKITIMLYGHEQSRPELGFRLLERLAADVKEYSIVGSRPKQDGRNMAIVLGSVRDESKK